MTHNRLGHILRIAVLLCGTTMFARAQTYNLVHLGFSGNFPTGQINNLGQVVGYNNLANTAFLYSGGVVTSLGVSYGYARGINSVGQVIVYDLSSHSYLASPPYTSWTDLGTLGGGDFYAHAINDSGTVVGSGHTISGSVHAFMNFNGTMTDLGSIFSDSDARSINNSGQIVGDGHISNILGYYTRAFQMVNGTMTDLDPAYQNYDMSATAINDAGQFVVNTDKAWCSASLATRSARPSQKHPCRGPSMYVLRYSAGGIITNLGSLGGPTAYGLGINSYGDVVGQSDTANGAQHAFLYTRGAMTDLNSHAILNARGWTFLQAWSINDFGQIVGQGIGPAGQDEMVVLTPVPN